MGRPREFEQTAVLDLALELFWDKGYEATSVRDLTTQLDISNSTLYSAFGDKHALYLAVLAHYRGRELAEFAAALQGGGAVLATLNQFFTTLAALGAETADQRGSFALAAAVELGLRDETVAEQLREHFDDLTGLLAGYLATAMRRGEISNRFSAGDLAHYLLHNLYSIGMLTSFFPGRFDSEPLSAVVLSVLDPDP